MTITIDKTLKVETVFVMIGLASGHLVTIGVFRSAASANEAARKHHDCQVIVTEMAIRD